MAANKDAAPPEKGPVKKSKRGSQEPFRKNCGIMAG